MSNESPELANQLSQMIQKEVDRENEKDNKIFELLNNQQLMAKQEFQEEMKITRYGQWFGFGVVVLLLISSIVLTILGNPTASSIAIGATLVGIVGKFVRTNEKNWYKPVLIELNCLLHLKLLSIWKFGTHSDVFW